MPAESARGNNSRSQNGLSIRDPYAADAKARSGRAFLLVLLTLVLPGSAQLLAGSKAVGRFALRIDALVLLAAITGFLGYKIKPAAVIAPFTASLPLIGIMALVFLLAVGWAVLFLDAWRLGGSHGLPVAIKTITAVVTVALIAATSGPLVYGTTLLQAHRTLLGSVFADGPTSKPDKGRYNFLLIGGDAGEGRVGLRNDTMIVLSIDADTGAAVQIGVPRNLEDPPFAGPSTLSQRFAGGFVSDGGDNKINAVYRYGQDHAQAYPDASDPGAAAVMEAVSGALGIRMHHYVLVDMHGFESMVDALGGIKVDVRKRVPRASVVDKTVTEGYIEPGVQELNGYDALWFARSRYDSSDYERMQRQRCVVAAAMNQLDPRNVLAKYIAIADSSADLVSTDIPQSTLARYAGLGLKVRGRPVINVQLTPPEVNTGNPDYSAIHAMVQEALRESERQPAAVQPQQTDQQQPDAETREEAPQPSPQEAQGGAPQDASDTTGQDTSDDVICVAL